MFESRVNPNLSNTLTDCGNRLRVVCVEPLLNPTQLKTGKPPRV
jgi:hypothetical protein